MPFLWKNTNNNRFQILIATAIYSLFYTATQLLEFLYNTTVHCAVYAFGEEDKNTIECVNM